MQGLFLIKSLKVAYQFQSPNDPVITFRLRLPLHTERKLHPNHPSPFTFSYED